MGFYGNAFNRTNPGAAGLTPTNPGAAGLTPQNPAASGFTPPGSNPMAPQQPANVWGRTTSTGAPIPGSGTTRGHGPTTFAPTGTDTSGATGAPMDGPLSGPGYGEDWYKQHGQDLMGTPSASEKLYAEGDAGSNPFYDYAQQQTIKAINDASAARGNFNSSYTMRNIGNAVADLRGQQAHELGQLAGQSDAGKFGRYDRTADYSQRAQGLTEGRARQSIDASMGLANGQANQVGGFYGEAGRESQQAGMAKIETQLKEAGLSAEETKAAMDMFFGGMKAVASF